MSSLKVVQFLDAVARMNEQLVALEQGFWMLPGVGRVSRGLDIRRYDYGLVLDAYVDVGTMDGNSMAWLLEIVWDEPGPQSKSSVDVHRDDERLAVLQ